MHEALQNEQDTGPVSKIFSLLKMIGEKNSQVSHQGYYIA